MVILKNQRSSPFLIACALHENAVFFQCLALNEQHFSYRLSLRHGLVLPRRVRGLERGQEGGSQAGQGAICQRRSKIAIPIHATLFYNYFVHFQLEAMIDSVIDRVLGKDPLKTEDVVVDQIEGNESCKVEEEPTETASKDTDTKEDGQCVKEKPGASEDKEGAGAKSMAALVDMMASANIAIGQSGVVDIPTVVMETAAKEDSNCVEEKAGACKDEEGVEPRSMEALAEMMVNANIVMGQSGVVDILTVVKETVAKEDHNKKDGICVEEKPGASNLKEGVEPKSMEVPDDMIANADIAAKAAKGDNNEKDGVFDEEKQDNSKEEEGAGFKPMDTPVDLMANANIVIGESGVVDIPSVVVATATKEDDKVKEEERK